MNGTKCFGAVGIVLALAVALAVLISARPAAADPPTPVSVLFVANGYYVQETQIEQHLLATGAFTVTRIKDYKLKSTTNLAPYDLVILTEFAPNVSVLP